MNSPLRRLRLTTALALLLLGAFSGIVRAEDIDLHAAFSDRELRELWLPPAVTGLGGAPKPVPFTLGEDGTPAYGGVIGVDGSHHNTDCEGTTCSCRIDWTALKAAKVGFAFFKASTGRGDPTPPDPTFSTHWKELEPLHANGEIMRGAFHWLTADGSSGREQALHFLSVVKASDSQLPPVVDFEEDPQLRSRDYATARANRDFCKEKKSRRTGATYFICDGWRDVSRAQKLKILSEWLETVEKATSMVPIIYTRTGYWETHLGSSGVALAKKHPFWLAQYPIPPKLWHNYHKAKPWFMPPLPTGASYPAQGAGARYISQHIWQFTEEGQFAKPPIHCDNQATNRSMDLNWFPGSSEHLKASFAKRNQPSAAGPK
jgi:GH25 family lysozyme M1 (1,4-beta-N-acetylmuramidase)